MASPISLYLLLLALLSQTHLSFSTTDPAIGQSSTPDVHDLLSSYNLPKGIIPGNVKSYNLSSTRDFTLYQERTCYVYFDELVYYAKTIKGKLSYESVYDVSGIRSKVSLFWLPVTGIEVDAKSGMVQFFVGSLSRRIRAEQFQDIPVCRSKPLLRDDLIGSN